VVNAIEQIEEFPPEPKGIAYSYVRFSTVKQELGDSLRRQVEMAEEYCAKHNLDLHPVSYRDLGVSAFKRKNVEKGALASFIEAVRTGKIAKDSFLVIEQFDRLSRDDANKALRLLLDLVDAGIRVVTLVDEKIWDKATIKDIGNLLLALVYMSRANNESATKAGRLRGVWEKKKKEAANGTARRIVTSECPRWLMANADKSGFIVRDEVVESIKKVFDMRINGHGIGSIVTRANQEGWPAPGKASVRKSGEDKEDFKLRALAVAGWHTSNVGRLLKNRALLGEYMPHQNDPDDDNKRIALDDDGPILGYYPVVLDETTFLRAQAKADRSGRFPGRRDASLKNWLQGLLRCNCGNSFVRKNKNSLAQPGYARYYCTARNRAKSRCPGVSAKELEMAVLDVVSKMAPQYFQGTARMETLKVKVDVLALDVSTAKTTRDRYLEALGTSKVPVASIMKRLGEAELVLDKLERELMSTRAELADLAGDSDTVFENILKAVESLDSLDARALLREELSRIIEKAVVHQADGYILVHMRGHEVPIVQPLRPSAVLPGIQFTTVPASSLPPEPVP